MSTLIVSVWLTNIACDTVGQIAFKYSEITSRHNQGLSYWKNLLSNYWLWIDILTYFLGFLLWLAFLSLVPL